MVARIEAIFVQTNRAIVAFALAAVFLIVFSNVVGRYLLGSSLPWAEEMARHLMIFGAFSGAGLALREGKLVAIDVLINRFASIRHIIRWGGVVLMGLFVALLIWFGAKFVGFGWSKETMATQVPRGIPYLSIPIGAGLFLVHLVLFARRYVAGAFETDLDEEST